MALAEQLWGERRVKRGVSSVAHLVLVALWSVAGLQGCVSEEYFCDAVACYHCDGISCREADLPTRIACRGDFECQAGKVCTSLGCVDSCDGTSPDTCPEGTVCRVADSLCLGPSEEAPMLVPGDCVAAEDCPGSGFACLDGQCAAVPGACEADPDCSDGARCVAGRCEPDASLCQFSIECESGLECVNSRCVARCGAGCPAGLLCDSDGFCRVDQTPGECVQNSECGAGQLCLDTRCVAECTADGDCDSGFYCDAGRCRFDDRPAPPFCPTNACAPGRQCVDGVCRTPCTSDAECARFDNQVPFCVDNLCVTQKEARSDCDTQQSCEAEQSCIDGTCR